MDNAGDEKENTATEEMLGSRERLKNGVIPVVVGDVALLKEASSVSEEVLLLSTDKDETVAFVIRVFDEPVGFENSRLVSTFILLLSVFGKVRLVQFSLVLRCVKDCNEVNAFDVSNDERTEALDVLKVDLVTIDGEKLLPTASVIIDLRCVDERKLDIRVAMYELVMLFKGEATKKEVIFRDERVCEIFRVRRET